MQENSDALVDDQPTPDSPSAHKPGDGAGTGSGGEDSVGEKGADLGSEVRESEELRRELVETRKELDQLQDRFLRQAADFQNFRKRAVDERAFSVEIGRSQVALPVVDVLDDLRRSLEAFAKTSEVPDEVSGEALRDGVVLVYDKLEAELEKLGIKAMDVVGQPFDEELHDAMMQQPAPEGTAPGTVLAEVQKGYMIGDRVLRHARVVVAT